MRSIWLAYFTVKTVLIFDLVTSGPVSSFAAALTGLPIR